MSRPITGWLTVPLSFSVAVSALPAALLAGDVILVAACAVVAAPVLGLVAEWILGKAPTVGWAVFAGVCVGVLVFPAIVALVGLVDFVAAREEMGWAEWLGSSFLALLTAGWLTIPVGASAAWWSWHRRSRGTVTA